METEERPTPGDGSGLQAKFRDTVRKHNVAQCRLYSWMAVFGLFFCLIAYGSVYFPQGISCSGSCIVAFQTVAYVAVGVGLAAFAYGVLCLPDLACPSCNKCVYKPISSHCPLCGSDKIERTVFQKKCGECEKVLWMDRQGFLVGILRFCTHCGAELSEVGFERVWFGNTYQERDNLQIRQ